MSVVAHVNDLNARMTFDERVTYLQTLRHLANIPTNHSLVIQARKILEE